MMDKQRHEVGIEVVPTRLAHKTPTRIIASKVLEVPTYGYPAAKI